MKRITKYIIISVINIIVILIILILHIIANSMAVSQRYNYTADLWQNNNKDNFSQVSVFLSEEAGFTTESLNAVRSEIIKELKNISVQSENGALPFAESYSAQIGTFTVRGELSGRSDAMLTATGGDFFMFRNFTLIDGAFFSDDDLMQDGAVIDRSLAWSLYGAYDIAGMPLYINGIKFYISGVIENPQTTPEKKCTGSLPRIYISYDGASHISGLSENSESKNFTAVTCYETVLPNPVENFSYNLIKKQFSENYKDKYLIVKNSERFSPSVRAKAFREISDYAIIKNDIKYPYWENASRIVEFKLTFIYFSCKILLAVPAVTILWLIVLAVRLYRKIKPSVMFAVSVFIDRRRRDIKEKFFNKQKKV